MALSSSLRVVAVVCLFAVAASAATDAKDKGATAAVAVAAAANPKILVTPQILTGMFAGLVWLTIFTSGFCCLFQLQTPYSYEEKCLTLNKEY